MNPQLIVALDVDSKTKALKLVKSLYPKVKIFKIGLQLFTKEGPQIIKAVQKVGAKVFLDLKFYDIPNTVKNAVAEAGKLGVFMLTIHASGGEEMLKAATACRIPGLNLLGVTVLTSKKYPGFEKDVLSYAKLAQKCGLQGIVCSVSMAKLLKKQVKGLFFVCPGIRLDDAKDDQEQTATPREAKEAGVDYIVVGRPVVKAADPAQAVDGILKSL